jgi:DNA-3-methyladenine glycosylase
LKKLPLSFYTRNDVLQISKELLGKFLLTNIGGKAVTGGMIVETEAYHGPEDKASHAYGGRYTERTKIMYEEGGIAYIYFCYGIHYLFNVVTNINSVPHAVLVRALEPVEGIDLMLQRRKKDRFDHRLTAGPGSVCQALGITKMQNGLSLIGDEVWIEDRNIHIDAGAIVASPRVGVPYAAEHALLPWRFRIRGNKYSSPAK